MFKDEESREGYISPHPDNEGFINRHYEEGYTIAMLTNNGGGYHYDATEDFNMRYVISKNEIKYFKEKIMSIKPEDEVTITTTYGELARVYAVIGNANGSNYPNKEGYSFWGQLKKLLDPKQVTYDSFFFGGNKKKDILDYRYYQTEWVRLLFPQKPPETEQQRQIRELREQAEELLAKAKKLEGGV